MYLVNNLLPLILMAEVLVVDNAEPQSVIRDIPSGLQAAATLEDTIRTEIEETRAATAAMQAAISRADAMLKKLADQITPVVSLCQPDQGHLACCIRPTCSMPELCHLHCASAWGMSLSPYGCLCH